MDDITCAFISYTLKSGCSDRFYVARNVPSERALHTLRMVHSMFENDMNKGAKFVRFTSLAATAELYLVFDEIAAISFECELERDN